MRTRRGIGAFVLVMSMVTGFPAFWEKARAGLNETGVLAFFDPGSLVVIVITYDNETVLDLDTLEIREDGVLLSGDDYELGTYAFGTGAMQTKVRLTAYSGGIVDIRVEDTEGAFIDGQYDPNDPGRR